jgi:hypothetical protein
MKIVLTFLFLLMFTSAMSAQDMPRVEGSIGYTGIRAGGDYTNGLSTNGGYNFFRGSAGSLGGEFEYSFFSDSGNHLNTFQVGPVYSFGTSGTGKSRFFGRALFGGAKPTGNGISAPTIFGGTIGGGVKVPVAESFHVRFGPDYRFFRNAGAQVNAFAFTIGLGFGK